VKQFQRHVLWHSAAGLRLFHGGGREALATYRTAAAVGRSSPSVLLLVT
jgi:hypothetical protein